MNSYSSVYESVLVSRYAAPRMAHIFSPQHKYRIWRELWIALAQAQKDLGLKIITQRSLDEMRERQENFDPQRTHELEVQLKHDVMAHIEAFGEKAPEARKILHLGATSAFIADNADLVMMRQGLLEIRAALLRLIRLLRDFSYQHRDLATLGYTHFQVAQLTTVGKRSAVWMQSFITDCEAIHHLLSSLPFLGVKGTTGTQASFATLFEGDFAKVQELDRLVAQSMGFSQVQAISGQTYDRKTDHTVLSLLSGVAQSAHKMTNDLRLLQHMKELEEPFASMQVGSSAMAYKRNPIYAERVASLAKLVISLASNASFVSSTQWLERSLDDSANRRISLPETFLATSAILRLLCQIVQGLKVYPKIIARHVQQELPFMATETILMECVKRGMDRQNAHEILRSLSMGVAVRMREEGGENDLLHVIAKDGRLGLEEEELAHLTKAQDFVGFAPQQVVSYIEQVVDPLLVKSASWKGRANLPLPLEDEPSLI